MQPLIGTWRLRDGSLACGIALPFGNLEIDKDVTGEERTHVEEGDRRLRLDDPLGRLLA